MVKIGTAHLEIKPMLNEESLGLIEERIAHAVERGVRIGLLKGLDHLQERDPDA